MGDRPMPKTFAALTAQIVSAHVRASKVKIADLPHIIAAIHGALTGTGMPPVPEPAVPIKESVTPDHVICLEDGEEFKMMKRHLMVDHNLSPDRYRQRWNLPASYPMTAPNYAKIRSGIAKKLGLGAQRSPSKR